LKKEAKTFSIIPAHTWPPALGRPHLAVMPAKAGIFLAVAGTTLWLCSMPRRQKMPAFAGMTDYSRA
jgi:hypothetical protein